MIKLGSKVKDTLTGFEGILTARTEWLYGCVRYGVDATCLDKDGKVRDTSWFDEQRVELVKEEKPKISKASKASKATTGGPRHDPSRASDARR